ncbi:hypothetical protein jhhlp_005281 [Lomentospora prolificans]|uniref:Non-homologous end-joining factor 1 n=1 Tax=Lomentospora prolificans TaxID=41688 RepID=A0A2N3N7F7_9PEZI|nr:hypothetical protein jhhlp_005281 [Lomentospora prolificans]
MSLTATWRPLPVKQSRNLPTLLASTRFSTTSYALHITDLAHVWSESLDRRAIILRALKEDTSIDPSDGEENMNSFLKCLRAAFDPDDSMHNLARVAVSHAAADPGGKDGLTVTVTCELPRELSNKPLTWRMYLKMQPASTTTAELVFPLVEAHRAQQEQIKSLVEVIKQKDSVINKVLDKLEAMGTSLEHVFTVLSTKRKATREQAEARIKGLATFDFQTWNSTVADGTRQNADGETPELLRRVFDEGGLEYTQNMDSKEYAEGLGRWWSRLSDTGGLPPDDASEPESTIGKGSAPASQKFDSQRSKSPAPSSPKCPPPASRASKPKSSDFDDALTASETESEDDSPPKKFTTLHPPTRCHRPSPPASLSPPPAASTRAGNNRAAREAARPASASGSATRSPTPEEGDKDEARAKPSPARPRGVGIGRIGGIGVIGGKGRARQPSEEDEDDGFEGGGGGKKEEVKSPAKKQVVRPVKKKRKF